MFFEQFKLIQRLIPDSDCLLCKQPVTSIADQSKLLCHYCHLRLPTLLQGCPVCAMPLFQVPETACGSCLESAPGYSKTVTAFHYEPPVSDFITALKFNGQRRYLPLLSDYLLAAIHRQYQHQKLPAAIIPVPLHPKKIRQRGFNQSQLIAQKLAKRLNLPLLTDQVKRIRNTLAQSALDSVQRQRNLRGAFSVKPITQQTFAIVDDVVTTGATANELSQQLLKAGAEKVEVWCIARAFSA